MSERQWLQRVVALGALIPVTAGLYGVLFGVNGIRSGVTDISVDSQFRYLSGLLLGIGVLFWFCVPDIAKRTRLFRFLTLVVLVGGFARLLGLWLTGLPSLTMLVALGIELVVTPLLCLWQARIAAGEATADPHARGSGDA